MESNNNFFSNFGEKSWDSINSNVSDSSNQKTTSGFLSSSSGGADILQQSLQQAQIYDGGADPLDFDDFGFTFNSDTSFNNNTANDNKQHSESYGSSNSYHHDDFDVSEFLNLTSTVAKTTTSVVLSGQSANQSNVLLTSSSNASLENSAKTLVHHQPNIFQSLPKHENIISTADSTSNKQSFAKPITYVHLQFPKSETTLISDQVSTSNVLSKQPNNQSQYVFKTVQTASPQAYVPHTVYQMSTVQTKPVAVNNNVIFNQSSLPLSSVSVLPTNSVSLATTTCTPSLVNSKLKQPNLQVTKNSTFYSSPGGNISDEQTNKLAYILQTKAANQPGPGSILKVGNQNIDVSDPAIAKVLAARILQQQKIKLQSSPVPLSSTAVHSTKPNVTIYNFTPVNLVNSTLNQQPSQQHLNTNASTTLHSDFSTTSKYPVLLGSNKVNSASLQTGKRSPIVHLSVAKSNSPSQINRIQIASVNIARTSGQPAINAIQRISSPIVQNTFSATSTSVPSVPISGRSPVILSTQVVSAVNPQKPSVIQHMSPSIKVNISSHQTNSLAKGRLQKLIVQPQSISSPKAVNSINSKTIPSVAPETKLSISSNGQDGNQTKGTTTKIVSFRVDPNLTSKQVDEVQQVISKKLPLSRINEFTSEQKQLLNAFRAQLRTMEVPIQQYYLRNPELFLQKVFQHIVQTGKPFVFHIKIGQPNTTSVPANTSSKLNFRNNEHPTISLNNSAQKTLTASAIPSRTNSTVLQQKVLKRTLRNAPEVTIDQPPSKQPSLILEQLQQHRKLAANPTLTPFVNVRDAYRRLLPFHVFNTPEIKKSSFDGAEVLFNQLSEDILNKSSKMLKKYHLLCLKDSATDVCSADAVMLERTFLQQEKAAFAEMKRNVQDDPDSLLTYLPSSFETTHPHVISFLEDQINFKLQPPTPNQYFSEVVSNSSCGSNLAATASSVAVENPHFAQGNFENGDPMQSELLLQEAVESILS